MIIWIISEIFHLPIDQELPVNFSLLQLLLFLLHAPRNTVINCIGTNQPTSAVIKKWDIFLSYDFDI